VRLEKIINGEQGGISKDVDWQGGDSVVVCELMQWNGRYVDEIQAAQTAEKFAQLSLAGQKRFLPQVLDKNPLYVNLSEVDDADYKVSEENERLNRQFYGM